MSYIFWHNESEQESYILIDLLYVLYQPVSNNSILNNM